MLFADHEGGTGFDGLIKTEIYSLLYTSDVRSVVINDVFALEGLLCVMGVP
jgi:hypothetical protein